MDEERGRTLPITCKPSSKIGASTAADWSSATALTNLVRCSPALERSR
jgi:hypothetical protein